ncbi:hypothetical protein SAMN05421505_12159 [Sinosporangium album]|uniref:Uncharacterized protein n=1 Tax=Sinosporangium album TaxID=504805 RepID=A0A1G8EUB3_9ACTN|nr:hypothetical protein SAMN05421505_12159 [Sinosporangium album]
MPVGNGRRGHPLPPRAPVRLRTPGAATRHLADDKRWNQGRLGIPRPHGGGICGQSAENWMSEIHLTGEASTSRALLCISAPSLSSLPVGFREGQRTRASVRREALLLLLSPLVERSEVITVGAVDNVENQRFPRSLGVASSTVTVGNRCGQLDALWMVKTYTQAVHRKWSRHPPMMRGYPQVIHRLSTELRSPFWGARRAVHRPSTACPQHIHKLSPGYPRTYPHGVDSPRPVQTFARPAAERDRRRCRRDTRMGKVADGPEE